MQASLYSIACLWKEIWQTNEPEITSMVTCGIMLPVSSLKIPGKIHDATTVQLQSVIKNLFPHKIIYFSLYRQPNDLKSFLLFAHRIKDSSEKSVYYIDKDCWVTQSKTIDEQKEM